MNRKLFVASSAAALSVAAIAPSKGLSNPAKPITKYLRFVKPQNLRILHYPSYVSINIDNVLETVSKMPLMTVGFFDVSVQRSGELILLNGYNEIEAMKLVYADSPLVENKKSIEMQTFDIQRLSYTFNCYVGLDQIQEKMIFSNDAHSNKPFDALVTSISDGVKYLS
jgi:hypothetical protein